MRTIFFSHWTISAIAIYVIFEASCACLFHRWTQGFNNPVHFIFLFIFGVCQTGFIGIRANRKEVFI